jgi:hypothetical protein
VLVRAVHENKAVVRLNCAMHNGEAESASTRFRRYERLKEPLLDRIRYSAALIGNSKHYGAARKMLGLTGQLMVSELNGFQPDFAA